MDFKEWLPALQSLGIISSFLLTVHTIQKANKGRRSANYLALLNNYRSLWALTLDDDTLAAALSADTKISLAQCSEGQGTFLRMVILHLATVFELAKAGEITTIEELRADAKELLVAPAVREFWIASRPYYNRAFVHFLDNCLYEIDPRPRSIRQRVRAGLSELRRR